MIRYAIHSKYLMLRIFVPHMKRLASAIQKGPLHTYLTYSETCIRPTSTVPDNMAMDDTVTAPDRLTDSR